MNCFRFSFKLLLLFLSLARLSLSFFLSVSLSVCLSPPKFLLFLSNPHKFYASVTQQMPLSQPNELCIYQMLSWDSASLLVTLIELCTSPAIMSCGPESLDLFPVWIRRSGPSVHSGTIFFPSSWIWAVMLMRFAYWWNKSLQLVAGDWRVLEEEFQEELKLGALGVQGLQEEPCPKWLWSFGSKFCSWLGSFEVIPLFCWMWSEMPVISSFHWTN